MSSLSSSSDITVNTFNTDITSTTSSKKSSILTVFALKAISLILLGVGIMTTLYGKRPDDCISVYSCLSGVIGLCLYLIAHKASTTEFTRKQNCKDNLDNFINYIYSLWSSYICNDDWL